SQEVRGGCTESAAGGHSGQGDRGRKELDGDRERQQGRIFGIMGRNRDRFRRLRNCADVPGSSWNKMWRTQMNWSLNRREWLAASGALTAAIQASPREERKPLRGIFP